MKKVFLLLVASAILLACSKSNEPIQQGSGDTILAQDTVPFVTNVIKEYSYEVNAIAVIESTPNDLVDYYYVGVVDGGVAEARGYTEQQMADMIREWGENGDEEDKENYPQHRGVYKNDWFLYMNGTYWYITVPKGKDGKWHGYQIRKFFTDTNLKPDAAE